MNSAKKAELTILGFPINRKPRTFARGLFIEPTTHHACGQTDQEDCCRGEKQEYSYTDR